MVALMSAFSCDHMANLMFKPFDWKFDPSNTKTLFHEICGKLRNYELVRNFK